MSSGPFCRASPVLCTCRQPCKLTFPEERRGLTLSPRGDAGQREPIAECTSQQGMRHRFVHLSAFQDKTAFGILAIIDDTLDMVPHSLACERYALCDDFGQKLVQHDFETGTYELVDPPEQLETRIFSTLNACTAPGATIRGSNTVSARDSRHCARAVQYDIPP